MKNWLTYEHGVWEGMHLLGDIRPNKLEWVSSGYVTFDPDKVVAITDIEGYNNIPEPTCVVYLIVGQFFIKKDRMRVLEDIQNALP